MSMENDPEAIQTAARESMVLPQDEIDLVNERLMKFLRAGRYVIEMMRILVDDDTQSCIALQQSVNVFLKQFKRYKMGHNHVTTTATLSYALSKNTELYRYGIGLLAYFEQHNMRCIIVSNVLKLTPKPKIRDKSHGGSGSGSGDIFSSIFDSLFGPRLEQPSTRRTTMYTLSVDLGRSTLSNIETSRTIETITNKTQRIIEGVLLKSPRFTPLQTHTIPRTSNVATETSLQSESTQISAIKQKREKNEERDDDSEQSSSSSSSLSSSSSFSSFSGEEIGLMDSEPIAVVVPDVPEPIKRVVTGHERRHSMHGTSTNVEASSLKNNTTRNASKSFIHIRSKSAKSSRERDGKQ